MIFARKMPDFCIIIARKLFFPNFRRARALPPCPRLLRLWCFLHVPCLRSTIRSQWRLITVVLFSVILRATDYHVIIIITELSRPSSRAHLTDGDGGLVVQGNPGLDWRPRSDALRTDRLGRNSWQRLRRLRHGPEEERYRVNSYSHHAAIRSCAAWIEQSLVSCPVSWFGIACAK